jgi:Zn-dependent peptidase ImmA (M78 family)/DNA-binding XRE family transcriptional regulator
MTAAIITPKLIQWARERSRFSPQVVAQRANIKPEQLSLWENGEAWPTFRQARNLARALHVPFGYLFLSSPPEEKPALPDLREIRDIEYQSFSADFLDLLNDVLRKHQWYREYLIEEGVKPLGFCGRFSIKDNVEVVAKDIGQALGIDEGLRQEAVNWEDFLRKCIQRIEAEGILVLRSGVVGNNPSRKLLVEEFRGFAVSDDLAPLIFLNRRDAKAAQIFTLAHELAHLWVGESGISNPELGEPSLAPKNRVECFCNHVAAELLVPQAQFLKDWQVGTSVTGNLYQLVRYYRVSSLVILRRAYDLEKITRDEYDNYYQQEIKKHRTREERQEGEGGGDFYATLLSRNSKQLTNAIIAATFEGRLLYRDAARLLSVKVKTIEGIARNLETR